MKHDMVVHTCYQGKGTKGREKINVDVMTDGRGKFCCGFQGLFGRNGVSEVRKINIFLVATAKKMFRIDFNNRYNSIPSGEDFPCRLDETT